MTEEQVTRFRSQAARVNYVCQDRPHMVYADKEICRSMSCPAVRADKALRRVIRFMTFRPRLVWRFDFQRLRR